MDEISADFHGKEPNSDYLSSATMRLVHQGAEAKLYECTFLGRKAIVKERFVKTYRNPILDRHLTKERFRGEIR